MKKYDDCDNDESDEIAAFLPSSNGTSTNCSSMLDKMQDRSRLRALELSLSRVGSLTSRNYPFSSAMLTSKQLLGRCRTLLVILAALCVILGWSKWETNRYTAAQQGHQLRPQDILHWCLDPHSESCACPNPLYPQDRFGYNTWDLAHDRNVQDALEASDKVDVVLLGDSITEGWRGTSFGRPNKKKKDNAPVYEKMFHKDKGSAFQGLALGIAGDQSPHLLWRLKNGEMPDSLQPKVWWILIGTNDFQREHYCSPEVVFLGIEQVAEEVRLRRPDATIVLNSLLPRSDTSDGKLRHPKKQTVWDGIEEVNQDIREYCEQYENVVFFNATNLFIEQDHGGGDWHIPTRLMNDYIHPSALGYQIWGEHIVDVLHDLID